MVGKALFIVLLHGVAFAGSFTDSKNNFQIASSPPLRPEVTPATGEQTILGRIQTPLFHGVLVRFPLPNRPAWIKKRRADYVREVLAGFREQGIRGIRSKTFFKQVPTVDFRGKSTSHFLTGRILFFRTYTLVLLLKAPKQSPGMRKLRDSFKPYLD